MKKIVLIDGSNFYHKLKDLDLHKGIFDYKSFANWISEDGEVKCKYYVGVIRQELGNPKSKEMYAKQRKFFSVIEKQDIEIERGFMMKNIGYHEKGVDVKIAVDILVNTYEKSVDCFYLVSSDTDLIPAVTKVKEKGKEIKYIGFAHSPSHALIKNCSSSHLLSKEDLEKFLTKKETPKTTKKIKAKSLSHGVHKHKAQKHLQK
jgi:uncharacterized protein (TIGR00288 family)